MKRVKLLEGSRKEEWSEMFSFGSGVISAELHHSQDQRKKPSSGSDEGNSDISVEYNGGGESIDLLEGS